MSPDTYVNNRAFSFLTVVINSVKSSWKSFEHPLSSCSVVALRSPRLSKRILLMTLSAAGSLRGLSFASKSSDMLIELSE